MLLTAAVRPCPQDYIELFIQWGYLTLFGAAFPAAVCFAGLTNFIETRTDGRKLLRDFKRVVPARIDGLGEPLDIFTKTLYLAVPVNAGMVVWTFKAFKWVGADHQVWVFVGLCAVMFFLLSQSAHVFPDVPTKTKIQLQRAEVLYDHVIQPPQDTDELVLELSSSMIGAKLADVKALEKAREAEDLPVMTRMAVPVGWAPKEGPRKDPAQAAEKLPEPKEPKKTPSPEEVQVVNPVVAAEVNKSAADDPRASFGGMEMPDLSLAGFAGGVDVIGGAVTGGFSGLFGGGVTEDKKEARL